MSIFMFIVGVLAMMIGSNTGNVRLMSAGCIASTFTYLAFA